MLGRNERVSKAVPMVSERGNIAATAREPGLTETCLYRNKQHQANPTRERNYAFVLCGVKRSNSVAPLSLTTMPSGIKQSPIGDVTVEAAVRRHLAHHRAQAIIGVGARGRRAARAREILLKSLQVGPDRIKVGCRACSRACNRRRDILSTTGALNERGTLLASRGSTV